MTQAELLYGAYNSEKVDENLAKIDMLKKSLKVTGLDEKSLNIYARTKAELKRKGGLIDEFDLLIASVAIANGLILVTNNKKHFDRI
ncbi:MAG TPA: PIN domain-containing protein, partial [Candidatus Wallbacteria bacterium]|nr:PIN domain-containing protein [Candidatus Wallbacteria bacterium]